MSQLLFHDARHLGAVMNVSEKLTVPPLLRQALGSRTCLMRKTRRRYDWSGAAFLSNFASGKWLETHITCHRADRSLGEAFHRRRIQEKTSPHFATARRLDGSLHTTLITARKLSHVAKQPVSARIASAPLPTSGYCGPFGFQLQTTDQ